MSTPTYWRISSRGQVWWLQQTTVRNGFTWESMSPGVYEHRYTYGRICLVVENSFESPGTKSVQVDIDNDLWNIEALGCAWHGVTRDTMVGIQGMVVQFYLGLFTQALRIVNEKRAEKGLPPLPPIALPPVAGGA